MRKFVDHALCKLPFEVDWFKKRNVEATYVGHPYFDQLDRQIYDGLFLNSQKGKQLITLLPGSRNREVENNLPTLIQSAIRIAQACPETSFAVASANQKQMEIAQSIIEELKSASKDYFPTIELHVDRTPELMAAATACMACSGSVSLELMHHRKPTVIVYKIGRLISLAQLVLMRTRFITLVNLIAVKDIRKKSWFPADPDSQTDCAQSMIMPEYLSTGDVSAPAANQIINWLQNPDQLQARIDQLDALAVQYAKPGAVHTAADYILTTLEQQHAKDYSQPEQIRAA
jgi:lipid-A-disaccharide synthase